MNATIRRTVAVLAVVAALTGCTAHGAVDDEPVVAREDIPIGTPMPGAYVSTPEEIGAAQSAGLALFPASDGSAYYTIDPAQGVPGSIGVDITGRIIMAVQDGTDIADVTSTVLGDLTEAGLNPALLVPVTWGQLNPITVLGVDALSGQEFTGPEQATRAVLDLGAFDIVDLTGASR